MRYEIYADSLFLLNFIMNLYVLILVNNHTHGTATPLRLLLGSMYGSAGYLLVFLLPGPVPIKLSIGIATALTMPMVSFRFCGIKAFLVIVEKVLLFSFCIGGTFLFCINLFPPLTEYLMGIGGVMGVGGISSFFIRRVFRKKEKNSFCHATLIKNGMCLTITALLDSGNSLVEPISGKPVSVIDQKIFDSMWKGSEQLYRAIPYHSIGKKKGILKGYILPELKIDMEGMQKTFYDVYIAVCQENMLDESNTGTAFKMILNPQLLEQQSGGSLKSRQNVRRYDIKSCNAGKNAIPSSSQREYNS